MDFLAVIVDSDNTRLSQLRNAYYKVRGGIRGLLILGGQHRFVWTWCQISEGMCAAMLKMTTCSSSS